MGTSRERCLETEIMSRGDVSGNLAEKNTTGGHSPALRCQRRKTCRDQVRINESLAARDSRQILQGKGRFARSVGAGNDPAGWSTIPILRGAFGLVRAGHFSTSQWPPLRGPTRRSRPSLVSLAVARSTAETDLPIRAATSTRVRCGCARSSSMILSGVSTRVSTRVSTGVSPTFLPTFSSKLRFSRRAPQVFGVRLEGQHPDFVIQRWINDARGTRDFFSMPRPQVLAGAKEGAGSAEGCLPKSRAILLPGIP